MKLTDAYTGKQLMSFVGKTVRLECTDREVMRGELYGFTTKHDSFDGQVHVYIHSQRLGHGVDVGEDEIVSFSLI